MKKSILTIAVAASMVASTAVMADPSVYGNLHLSLNAADNDIAGNDNNLSVSNNTSALGVKGSEDLGDGMKAIYKIEYGVTIGPKPQTDPDAGFIDGSQVNSITSRDQFVGLKGGFGTIAFGTMSSNYKQMGGKVDPLYRTPLEGRGFLNTQSPQLHGGIGMNRGRETHTAQYTSPKMGGIQLVANTTFSGSNDETSGIGIRWSNKNILAYVDFISSQAATGVALQDCTTALGCSAESAVKVGGKYEMDAFSVALQYESAKDLTGADYIFAAGTYNIDSNNMVALTYGVTDQDDAAGAASTDSTGVAVAYNHNLSKMTNVYAGYGLNSSDVNNNDVSMLTFGIRKKF